MNEEIEHTNQFKSYKFDIADDSKSTGWVTFYQREDGVIKKSFFVSFLKEFENSSIKDFITATVMITDDYIDLEKAKDITNEIVVSLGNGLNSDIINLGEYSIYLDINNDSELTSGILHLNVLHNDDLNVPINKQEYKEFSYEEMMASLNAGEKTYLTGRVISKMSYDSKHNNRLYIEDENKNRYFIAFNFNDFLTEFELNETYTFYGKIFIRMLSDENIACLELDYYE